MSLKSNIDIYYYYIWPIFGFPKHYTVEYSNSNFCSLLNVKLGESKDIYNVTKRFLF